MLHQTRSKREIAGVAQPVVVGKGAGGGVTWMRHPYTLVLILHLGVFSCIDGQLNLVYLPNCAYTSAIVPCAPGCVSSIFVLLVHLCG